MKSREFVEVTLIRILVVILQLIFLKIYTFYTTTHELGVYYFLFTLSYSLNAFLFVPLDYFQQSKLYELKNEFFSLRSFFKINYKVLKVVCLILVVVSGGFLFYNALYSVIVVLVCITAINTYIINLIRGFVNNLEKRRVAIYTLLLENILKIVLFYFAQKYFHSSAIIILVSILLASIITIIILWGYLIRLDEFKFEKIKDFDIKNVLKFSYPISLSAMVNWVQLQGYRMVLVPLGLTELVGVYGTVANVGTSGMNAVSTIYSQLFVPNLYKTRGNYIGKYLRYAILAIIGVLIGGYLCADIIISLLTKTEFIKYSSLIIFGVLAEAGNFLIAGMTIYLTINNLTENTMKASIIGLVIFVISFLIICYASTINVYTIGIPIVITQLIISLYLLSIIYKGKLNEKI